MVQNAVFSFLDKTGFWWSLGSPPGSLFEVILGPDSCFWKMKFEKWRFGRQLEKRLEQHVKKGHATYAGSPPVAPLKKPKTGNWQLQLATGRLATGRPEQRL